jgi:hypothetical protein
MDRTFLKQRGVSSWWEKAAFFMMTVGICFKVTASLPEKEADKIRYIKDQYISEKGREGDFQEVLGNPHQAQAILFVFTSMTCPVCARFYTEILPFLKEYVSEEKFAIILRDYPADPLSLKASAMIWGNKNLALRLKREAYALSTLPEFTWIKKTEAESLAKLERYCKDLCASDHEKKNIEHFLKDKTLLQALFNKRVQDKKHLNITEVPTVFLFVKQEPRKMITIHDALDLPALREAILKATGK